MRGPMTRFDVDCERERLADMAEVLRKAPRSPQRDRDLERLEAEWAQLDVWLEQAE